MSKIYTLKEIVEDRVIPVGKSQMIKLIKYGEEQKRGRLREWLNYIIAMEIGLGDRRKRWGVSEEEIEAWQSRARKYP